jgi:hypothetical protein
VPNSQAQSNLIEETYQKAGLDFADTDYFEAHVSMMTNTGGFESQSYARSREQEPQWEIRWSSER